MRSRTSCFNRTIFRKNVTHYWPLWAVYLVYQLLALPLYTWRSAKADWLAENLQRRMYYVMEWAVRKMMEPVSVFLFSVVIAMAVFSYLFFARSANMLHALPVNRLELYVTNYMSGLSFLAVPDLITFLITVLVCLSCDITCIQYLFLGYLARLGMEFFAYTLAVFVLMFTGQIFAVPVYYLIVNFFYVGCVYLTNALVGLVTFGYSGYDIWERAGSGWSELLSPLYCAMQGMSVSTVYEEVPSQTAAFERVPYGLEIEGMQFAAVYAVVAILFAVAAYQVYKRRQLETTGDWISVRVVKPVFRWGVALCGGTLVSVVLAEIMWETFRASVYGYIVIGMIFGGCVCFFVAEMILKKSFRVFCRQRLAECTGCLAVGVLVLTLLEVDAFGIERWVPEAEDVAAAFVYMDYPVQVEDVPVLIAMQKEVVADKDAYLDIVREGGRYYYTTFRYYLTDGTVFDRRYPLPVTDAYADDVDTPSGRILMWEQEPEHLSRELLGIHYQDNQYYAGVIGLYTAEGIYYDYQLREEELVEVVEAVYADIAEANFAPVYQYSIADETSEVFGSRIRLEYYNPRGMGNYEYYAHYFGKDRAEPVSGMGTYVQVGPTCVHVARVLKELGITGEDALLIWTE